MQIRSKDERAQIVREWRASGVSAYQFAKSKGIVLNSLKRWASLEAERPAFVRLEVAPSSTPSMTAQLAIEVRGARVVVEKGFDAGLLRAVVEALS